MLLRKMLVSGRVIEDCLLVFILWHDKPRVIVHMCAAAISLKSRLNRVY